MGVIEVTDGACAGGVGVQVPIRIQPLTWPSFPDAYPYTCFNPVKPGANVMAIGSDKVFGVVETVPPLLIVHWLLETLPAPPGVTLPAANPFPASFTR